MGLKKLVGNWGEDYAVKLLSKQGYKILDKNFHSRYGEIDIVAIVLPVSSRKTAPFDPVSGRPMKRATIKDVSNLINK